MASYVVLMNLTDQGIKDIKSAPGRIDEAVRGLEAMGGKITAFYTTLGCYDYVVVADVPSDETGMAFLLKLGMAGNVRTTALKAFPREAFGQIVAQV